MNELQHYYATFKECHDCGNWKHVSDYYRCSPTRLRPECKKCYWERYNEIHRTNHYNQIRKTGGKLKETTRAKTRQLISKGILDKKDYCEHCETEQQKLEIHHNNYLDPKDIKTLCITCHKNLHKERGDFK